MRTYLKKHFPWLRGIRRAFIVLFWKTGRAIQFLKHHAFDAFIFIHINKTGGTSIEKALNIPTDHKTAVEKIEEIGVNVWKKKYTFTVVRNPWDKVVSQYHYRVNTNQTDLRDNSVEFNEWVKRVYREQDATYYDTPKMFMPQVDWISDEEGNILVDEIIRFENLEIEFNGVLNKLGKNISLPHHKKSNRSHYREYYDDETREIVRTWFEEDIEMFGYQF